MLAHKKLDVYRCAIDFLALATRIELTRGYASLGDQLRRAALSVPLNIAERVARTSEEDKARFFGIARGSAMECSAIIDCCGVIGSIETHRAEEATALLERVVAMLTRMCR